MQCIPKILTILVIYTEVVHLSTQWPPLDRYVVIINFLSAVIAEFVSKLVLPFHLKAIEPKIAVEKIKTAQRIERKPVCMIILSDAIETADLKAAGKRVLRKRLSTPPKHEEIITVINSVGLAHINEIAKSR